jgi:acyl-CoA synthetase (AMP-forming)/AMP-acid ligase II
MEIFTLYDTLERNLASDSGRIAIISGDNAVTYGELARQVLDVAGALWSLGVRRWDRVGIHLPKGVEEVAATFAVARLGAVIVNINRQRTVRQLEHVVQNCDIQFLFTDGRRAKQIAGSELHKRLKNIIVSGRKPDFPGMLGWNELPHEEPPPNIRPVDTDLAALLYTSGSTGMPKGVMISHRNFVDGTLRVAEYLENNSQDRVLGLVPLSAPWGLIQATTMFLRGGTLVLQPIPMPAEIVSTINRHGVTGMAAFPETWIQMVGYIRESGAAMKSLRYITSSGGKIPMPVLSALPECLPGVDIHLTYGLTEAFRSTCLPPSMYGEKMGSLGRPCRNVDIFVVDPERGLRGPGERGELLHRGSLVTMGYWRQPEATAQAIRVCDHLRPHIGDEKVHYSGDIVWMDDDGYLWFVGRQDSMIKCGGHRISPTEVEAVVLESELVDNAVAFGVEHELHGQVVHIAVASDSGAVDEGALRRFCARGMPSYMVPHAIHVWDCPMPRTPNGKIDRTAVARSATENPRKEGPCH